MVVVWDAAAFESFLLTFVFSTANANRSGSVWLLCTRRTRQGNGQGTRSQRMSTSMIDQNGKGIYAVDVGLLIFESYLYQGLQYKRRAVARDHAGQTLTMVTL